MSIGKEGVSIFRASLWRVENGKVTIAQIRFAVGGLLIGFTKTNSPKVQKTSESGWIMPLRQRI